ncbi:MAG TPA: hypothetical protein VMV57_01010 [Terracidiphilus sp.]|nr:hypothetical protein [Terracidiphilus sp.]
MRKVSSSSCSFGGAACLSALLAVSAATAFAQAPAGASPADQPAAQCPLLDSGGMPLNQTLRVKVAGALDSGHLKPGKQVWFDVATGEAYPGCTLNEGAVIYAHVVSSSSTKSPDSAELSLAFDHADCEGHSNQPVRMILLGVLLPDEVHKRIHGEAPTTGGETSDWDENLNPGGQPGTIRPGVVVGLPNIKLDPQGGPDCSAKMTSTKNKIQLGPGTELFLALVKVVKK